MKQSNIILTLGIFMLVIGLPVPGFCGYALCAVGGGVVGYWWSQR